MIGIPTAITPPVEPEGEHNEQLWIEFAKHALTGHCSIGNVPGIGEPTAQNVSDWSCEVADLMVAEHAKRFRLKEPDFGALPAAIAVNYAPPSAPSVCDHSNLKTSKMVYYEYCCDCGQKI